MNKHLILLWSFFFSFAGMAQVDSTRIMDSVTVTSFHQNTYCCAVPVTRITRTDFQTHTSLLPGLNNIAGVRMEERSPGSYRLAFRGSSLRSPFGVRNIKVYWNGLPVTDPGGNTYFNQFGYNNFSAIEIYKGPAGSLYGAGTGGLILLNSFDDRNRWRQGLTLEYTGGSYQLHQVMATAMIGAADKRTIITYAHQQSDGYRVQTASEKNNISWTTKVTREKNEWTAALLFTSMYYQTPGALTKAEYDASPRAARPAGGGFPSAVAAKAAIYQKTILAGFTDQLQLTSWLKNTTTLYGSFAQIKNPAIRNYERRNEPSFGGRTELIATHRTQHMNSTIVLGAELQQGYFNTQVSKNRNGQPDTLLTNDDIDNATRSVFLQASSTINSNWLLLAGASINQTHISISRLSVYPVVQQARTYRNEMAPRVSIGRKWKRWQLNFLVEKGFSPPTVAEVLPSTGVISTNLEAERGWNKSVIIAYQDTKGIQFSLTGFHFGLKQALVQRRDNSSADYFVNAGDIRQEGIEWQSSYSKKMRRIVDEVTIRVNATYNHFRYVSFARGLDDYSGNKVPSVPASYLSFTGDLFFKNGCFLDLSWYAASKIYLNDANTTVANPYQLAGIQAGWRSKARVRFPIRVFGGVDNLFDEKYSAGNDINAAANRFYNAAPRRNFYAGVSWSLLEKQR